MKLSTPIARFWWLGDRPRSRRCQDVLVHPRSSGSRRREAKLALQRRAHDLRRAFRKDISRMNELSSNAGRRTAQIGSDNRGSGGFVGDGLGLDGAAGFTVAPTST